MAAIEPSAEPAPIVECDVSVVVEPDIDTVDALANLALAARRVGCDVRLRHATPDLQALVALVGLARVLPCADESGVEVIGQPEQREECWGIQEERDPADPIT